MSDFMDTYQPIVKKMLTELRVKRRDRDDIEQECYLCLLEAADLNEGTAQEICKRRINSYQVAQQREKVRGRKGKKDYAEPRAEILGMNGTGVTDEQLGEALVKIPVYDQYQVIHSIFVDGKTEEKTAQDLGLTRNEVRGRKQKGIEFLRKYFQENV